MPLSHIPEILRSSLFFIATLLVLIPPRGWADVFVIPIQGTIDLGLAPFVERTIREAEEQNAEAIIIEVDTFGGRMDAAISIKNSILNSRTTTIAFVNKKAISAGALISLATDTIVMTPGGIIGAALPVDQHGERASEKVISYMRSEMRATAAANGRRGDIAEAMVDEKIVIAGIVDETTLLTLTTDEALALKYCDLKASSLDQVLSNFGLSPRNIRHLSENRVEKAVRILTHPMISSLLLSLGLLGLFFEFINPGWGIAGIVGLVALTLFFGGHYLIQLTAAWEILLFLVGVMLILAEIFVLPGFGIAGISGLICVSVGLFFSLIGHLPSPTDLRNALIILGGGVLCSFFLIVLAWKSLPKINLWTKMLLTDEIKGTNEDEEIKYQVLIGMEGTTVTPLRPAGIIQLGERRFDAQSDGDFIPVDHQIVVQRVDSKRIIVRKSQPG